MAQQHLSQDDFGRKHAGSSSLFLYGHPSAAATWKAKPTFCHRITLKLGQNLKLATACQCEVSKDHVSFLFVFVSTPSPNHGD